MRRVPTFVLLILLLVIAGARPASADPIPIASGTLTSSLTEFRFTVPGAGPLVFDLFNAPGVYHTPLPPASIQLGGWSWMSGAFGQGTFALDGVPYAPPIDYRMTLVTATRWTTPGEPVTNWPFRLSGTFTLPGSHTVEFAGGGFGSIDATRTQFEFVANPPAVQVVTPEPGGLLLFGTALIGLAWRLRKHA